MEEIQKRLEKCLPSIARRIQNELVLVAPVLTGRLRNSIKVKETDDGLLIWMVDYGKFIEFGRNPRVITPTNKKALKFKVGGKTVFAKSVRQGAVRPNPFIRTVLYTKLATIIIEELSR